MEECTHDCSSCGASCGSREKTSMLEDPHALTHVKKVIGVVSGKGGVGKSLVTSLLASASQARGFETAVMDADVTGPSIPKAFGIHERAMGSDEGMFPVESKTGIKIMSINLLLEKEDAPVVWRGPVISGVINQFWQEVLWGDVDYMFVDMPPGTGDVPLTVFQSLPVDGIVIVLSPQELVGMIVEKAVKMAQMMNIPVLGLVENMAYMTCPDCGKRLYPFGEGRTADVAKQYGLPMLAQLPIQPELAKKCDEGRLMDIQLPEMGKAVDAVLKCKVRKHE